MSENTCDLCGIGPRAHFCKDCESPVCEACWREDFDGCAECADDFRRHENAVEEECDLIRDYFELDEESHES